ncbi:toll-like receptor 2 type-1 [Patella vulgata]|uniref:toll-like receptor 2 type-1 n=1 Tax=Patella vulgata TaxID=6465 RepID=UPI00218053D5|nr:toll-like receptor 2 type-1 [Patella vulgata]
MESSMINELEIRNIHLREFDQSMFLAFKNVRIMRVTDNKIRSTKFQHSFTTKNLSLAFNQIKEFPTFCVNGSAFFTNLQHLHLDDNRIWNIPAEKIACMKSLSFFSIDDNPIIKIDGNTFSTLPNLHVVSITYTGNTVLLLNAFAFNSSSIKQLYLEDDHFSVGDTYKHVHLNAFKYCNQLEILRLGSNYLSNATDDMFDELFSTLVNLKSLSLSDCELRYLPSFIPQYLKKLEVLYIDRNSIISIPETYFKNLNSLYNEDLSRNKITNIRKNTFSLKFLINMKVIDLSRNPFSCSCELLWFIKFMTMSPHKKFVHFPEAYTCYSPTILQGKQLKHVNISKHACAKTKQVRVIIISVSTGILLLLLTISVVYRYRWYLRYIIYIARFQRMRSQRLLNGGVNYKYDAYLSSCDADFDDVIYDKLVPILENNMGLRLYIPQRDGQGNKIDQIISNMDVSRKVILFISDNYVEDGYCEFEASFAYNKTINERRDLMIAVVLSELRAKNVTKTKHEVLAVNNYIKWGWDEESVELFWLKITIVINNMNDLIP